MNDSTPLHVLVDIAIATLVIILLAALSTLG